MEYLSPEEYKLKLENSLDEVTNSTENVSGFFKILVQTYKSYKMTGIEEYRKVFDEISEKREKRFNNPYQEISEDSNVIPYEQINEILIKSKIKPIKSLLDAFLKLPKNNGKND